MVILVFLLTAISMDAQIYSIGAGSPAVGYAMTILRVDEHRWFAGSVGAVQFRARTGEGAPWIRQTTFQVGASALTVRVPVITFITYSMLAVVIFLVTFVVGRRIPFFRGF
jgi:hypothetical protein